MRMRSNLNNERFAVKRSDRGDIRAINFQSEMAVLFTNNCWLFGLILVQILQLSSANYYESKNGNVFLEICMHILSLKYSIPNTDVISCSLVHPCPPGYYCSIVLGETGVCHEEDDSIDEVFSGSGEKEHMEDDVKNVLPDEKYTTEQDEINDDLEQEEDVYEHDDEDEKSNRKKRYSPPLILSPRFSRYGSKS